MEKMTYKSLFAFFALSVSFIVAAHANNNATQPVSSEIGHSFKEGMIYADMRQALLDAQWLPVRNVNCWDNLGNDKQVCSTFAEVQSCSSDARCMVSFANIQEQKQINIDVLGRLNETQTPFSITVKSWEFLPIQPVARDVCPSEDFTKFLQAFASDEKVKMAFTSAFVKVEELVENDTGDYGSQVVYVLAAQFDRFNLRYQGNSYHFVDYQNRVDPDALSLDISSPSENQRLIEFKYGMSEGNSYLFENRNGCWFLTEDPQAPSP